MGKSSVLILAIMMVQFVLCPEMMVQKANNHIAVGAEAGPILGNSFGGYRYQLGLPVKAYYGTGKQGQLMLRSGIHFLPVPKRDLHESLKRVNRIIIPLTLGYRKKYK